MKSKEKPGIATKDVLLVVGTVLVLSALTYLTTNPDSFTAAADFIANTNANIGMLCYCAGAAMIAALGVTWLARR